MDHGVRSGRAALSGLTGRVNKPSFLRYYRVAFGPILAVNLHFLKSSQHYFIFNFMLEDAVPKGSAIAVAYR